MNNPTPAQVAAMADLFGITPETHPHLADFNFESNIFGSWQLNLPDPLGPDADAVWLAPAMWWLREKNIEFSIHGEGCLAQMSVWVSVKECKIISTFTAALLQACLAARVPEVCRAMGWRHETSRQA